MPTAVLPSVQGDVQHASLRRGHIDLQLAEVERHATRMEGRPQHIPIHANARKREVEIDLDRIAWAPPRLRMRVYPLGGVGGGVVEREFEAQAPQDLADRCEPRLRHEQIHIGVVAAGATGVEQDGRPRALEQQRGFPGLMQSPDDLDGDPVDLERAHGVSDSSREDCAGLGHARGRHRSMLPAYDDGPMAASHPAAAAGAYGLAFPGLALTGLPAAPADARPLQLRREHSAAVQPSRRLGDATATIPYLGGGWAELDRGARTAIFHTPAPLDDDALAHPYLSPVASVFARWDGHEALHAGAVVGAGGAWAVIAPRGGGKSTTLAALSLAGHALVADDLLVVDHGEIFRGPSFVDLRPDAEARLGLGGRVTAVREGERGRLQAAPAEWRTPLAGIIFLDWAEDATVEPLGLGARFARLVEQRASGLEAMAPERALALAELPAWLVRRPQGAPLLETVEAVSSLIG